LGVCEKLLQVEEPAGYFECGGVGEHDVEFDGEIGRCSTVLTHIHSDKKSLLSLSSGMYRAQFCNMGMILLRFGQKVGIHQSKTNQNFNLKNHHSIGRNVIDDDNTGVNHYPLVQTPIKPPKGSKIAPPPPPPPQALLSTPQNNSTSGSQANFCEDLEYMLNFNHFADFASNFEKDGEIKKDNDKQPEKQIHQFPHLPRYHSQSSQSTHLSLQPSRLSRLNQQSSSKNEGTELSLKHEQLAKTSSKVFSSQQCSLSYPPHLAKNSSQRLDSAEEIPTSKKKYKNQDLKEAQIQLRFDQSQTETEEMAIKMQQRVLSQAIFSNDYSENEIVSDSDSDDDDDDDDHNAENIEFKMKYPSLDHETDSNLHSDSVHIYDFFDDNQVIEPELISMTDSQIIREVLHDTSQISEFEPIHSINTPNLTQYIYPSNQLFSLSPKEIDNNPQNQVTAPPVEFNVDTVLPTSLIQQA
jgi:hypothetical protein